MFDRFFNPRGVLLVKGPKFSSAQKIVINVDNAIRVSFMAPKHGGADPINKEEPFPAFIRFADVQEPHPDTPDGWPKYLWAGSRYWGFKGPYLSGRLATMSLSITVVKTKPKSEQFSFLNEGALVKSIRESLIEGYGNRIIMGHPLMVGPVNWKKYSQPVPCVSYCVTDNPTSLLERPEPSCATYECVLSDDCRMIFSLVYSIGLNVDVTNMQMLCEDIFNSIKIELSPQQYTQEQMTFFKQSAEALLEEYPPIKWVTPEQEAYAKACALYDKAVSLMDLFDYGSPEGDELDKYIDSIPIKSQCNGWDDETFDYSLPPSCPTELPPYLLAAMEKHGIHTEQDYKDFLIDHRYRRANCLLLLRPLSAARHLVEKSATAALAS